MAEKLVSPNCSQNLHIHVQLNPVPLGVLRQLPDGVRKLQLSLSWNTILIHATFSLLNVISCTLITQQFLERINNQDPKCASIQPSNVQLPESVLVILAFVASFQHIAFCGDYFVHFVKPFYRQRLKICGSLTDIGTWQARWWLWRRTFRSGCRWCRPAYKPFSLDGKDYEPMMPNTIFHIGPSEKANICLKFRTDFKWHTVRKS